MNTQHDGLLLVDKPPGKTSHDIVDYVRKKFKQKKVGHCGTLDPMATGLLMLVVGKATKIQDLLMSEDKEYHGQMKLGITTSTQDAEGEILETREPGEYIEETLQAAFDKFRGDFYQTPPMVSAIKKDGVPLYKLARQGVSVEREPRFVHVYHYKIKSYNSPHIEFSLNCSKGFYVRTYAHDIGQELGCGAHLTALRRTKSGNFNIDKAANWQDLEQADISLFLQNNLLSLAEVSHIRRQ